MALSAPVALSFRKHPSLFIYIFYLFYYVFSKFKAAQDAIEVGVIWPPFTRRFRLGFTLLRQHNDGYHLGIDGSRPACLCEALLCSQMLAPPQSLHWPLMRLCSQMLVPAVLGPAPDAVMLVDAGSPTAVLAHAPDAVMLVDAGAPAVLALAPDAVMLADAGAPAVLAGAPAAVMSQMPAPPQSFGAEEHLQSFSDVDFRAPTSLCAISAPCWRPNCTAFGCCCRASGAQLRTMSSWSWSSLTSVGRVIS